MTTDRRRVEAAHERCVVHRDFKPGNVVLTEAGSVKVLHFGLAKAMSDADRGPRATDTRTGVLMGTPVYMSPPELVVVQHWLEELRSSASSK
jgi:serine/threonine protein kinase